VYLRLLSRGRGNRVNGAHTTNRCHLGSSICSQITVVILPSIGTARIMLTKDPCVVRCRIVGIPLAALSCCLFVPWLILDDTVNVAIRCWLGAWSAYACVCAVGWWFSESRFLSTTLAVTSHIFGEVTFLRVADIVVADYIIGWAIIPVLAVLPLVIHAVRWMALIKLSIYFSLTEAAAYYCSFLFLALHHWRHRFDFTSAFSPSGADSGLTLVVSICAAVVFSWAGGRYIRMQLQSQEPPGGDCTQTAHSVNEYSLVTD